MTDETETDTSNFAKMFDRLPAFNPPDTNSAGAIALRAWVRGLTARGPPALAFLRKYEEDDFVSSYDSYLPSGTGSGAKKAYIARALMYALETRLEGTAQVYVDLLIQAKGDISAKGIFLSLIEEYKAGDASDVRRDLAALSANAHGGLRTTQLRLRVLANQHRIGANSTRQTCSTRRSWRCLRSPRTHTPTTRRCCWRLNTRRGSRRLMSRGTSRGPTPSAPSTTCSRPSRCNPPTRMPSTTMPL